MAVPVDELLRVNFCDRPVTEQIKIITAGKPQPPLKMPVMSVIGIDGNLLQNFNILQYDREVWLTGCDKRNAFFCWTCIMFEENKWNISGFNDFQKFDKALHAHKNNLLHLNGMIKFHTFLRNHRLIAPVPSNNIPNIIAKSNSGVLKRLIDVVCRMVPKARPPCQSIDQCTTEDCIKLLNLMKLYDDEDVVDEAISLVQNSPNVVTDIVTTLASVVRREVHRETLLSTFVSLVISKHRDVTGKGKISTIIRYVANGNVFERFLGFKYVNMVKTPIVTQLHITGVISELELSDKFLALSTDGSVPPFKYMQSFVPWLHQHHPRVLYVPCHFHEFSSVLQQMLSPLPECRLFFKYLKSLRTYFEFNPSLCSAFYNFAGGIIPDLRNLKLTDFQFLRVLQMHRRKFIQFFSFLSKETKMWAQDDLVKATAFQRILKEYRTIFLLETFFQLFERVAFISEMLSSGHPDGAFESEVAGSVIQELLRDKEDGFEKLWTHTAAAMIEDGETDTLKAPNEKKTQRLYRLFLKIIDCTIQSIQMRFDWVNNLNFIGIFDFEHRDKVALSNYHLQCLDKFQSSHFTAAPLAINEMKMLMRYSVLKRISANDLLDFLWRGNLHKTLKNLYKLVEFIVTLPCKPACPANSSAKFDSVKSWSSFPEQTDCLGLLSIEYDLLQYLKSKIKFYDEVISKLNSS